MLRMHLIIVMLLWVNLLFPSNNGNKDSLISVLKNKKADTAKIAIYNALIEETYQNNYKQAIEFSNESLKILKQHDYQEKLASSYKIRAYVYLKQHMFDSAQVYYKKAAQVYFDLEKSEKKSKKLLYREEKALCYYKQGNVFYHSGRYDSAVAHFQKAIKILAKLGKEKQLTNAYKNCGAAYQLKGNYSKALEKYHQALKLNENLGNKKQISDCYNNIGVINTELGNYDKALQYFAQSLKLTQVTGIIEDSAYTNANIGNVYFKMEKYEKALDYYKEALKQYKTAGRKSQVASTYTNMSNVYTKLKKYEKAINFYEQAIDIFEEINNTMGITYTLNSIASLYKQKEDYKNSILYAEKTLQMAKKSGMLQLEKMSNKTIAEAYEQIGNYSKALKYHKLFSSLKDSILNEKKHKQIAELQTRYETEKKEKLRWLAEKEKEIYLLKYNKQKHWNIFLSITIAVIAVFLTMVFIQSRKQRRTNKLLVRKNKVVVESEKKMQSQKEELEAIIQALQDQNIKNEVVEQTVKYSGSKLKQTEQQQMLEKIDDWMKNKKLFLQKDLNLEKFAKKLHTNRSYISQVINENYSQNFNNFLNEYRIKEACKLISDDKNRLFSIEGIAQNVGFNSIATFNRYFKKFTGVTPSFFLKEGKKLN